jgi:hypothetical protein
MGKKTHANRVLVGEPKEKRKFRRPRRKREDVGWIRVAQNRDKRQTLVTNAMNIRD